MHEEASASELMAEVDSQRRAAGLTQEAFAPLVGMTQGHYSKLVSGKAQPGSRAVASVRSWLSDRPAVPRGRDQRDAELRRIAGEITMQCMRLTDLVTRK